MDTPWINDLFSLVVIYMESLNKWQLFDLISQVFIFFMGLGIILIISCLKNKWGNVIGLIHQPFWYFTTWYHGQWVLFLMSLVYTIIWSVGIWQWFYKKPLSEN